MSRQLAPCGSSNTHIRIIALEEVVKSLTVQPKRRAPQVLSTQVSSTRGCNIRLKTLVTA